MDAEGNTFALYIESPETTGARKRLTFTKQMPINDIVMGEVNDMHLRRNTKGYLVEVTDLINKYPGIGSFIKSIHRHCADCGIDDIIDHVAEHHFIAFRLDLNERSSYAAALMFAGCIESLDAPVNDYLR